MPQEFMVLKCYNCEMFQVHQVKKAKKWQCKMCNEKQTQIKLFGKGLAKDCRVMVQNLNLNKKTKAEEKKFTMENESIEISPDKNFKRRWTKYEVNESENTSSSESDIDGAYLEIKKPKKERIVKPFSRKTELILKNINDSSSNLNSYSNKKPYVPNKISTTEPKKVNNNYNLDIKYCNKIHVNPTLSSDIGLSTSLIKTVQPTSTNPFSDSFCLSTESSAPTKWENFKSTCSSSSSNEDD